MSEREKLIVGVGDDYAEVLDLSFEPEGRVGLCGADPPVLLKLAEASGSQQVWRLSTEGASVPDKRAMIEHLVVLTRRRRRPTAANKA